MKNISPIFTKAWKNLERNYQSFKDVHMKEMFLRNKNRFQEFSINFDDKIFFDYSKNRIDQKIIENLIDLAKETHLEDAIKSMFCGKKINVTEGRSVSHMHLRGNILDENQNNFLQNIREKVNISLKKMKSFSEDVIQGIWRGYTGKKITDVVNIGIGGSNLGPKIMIQSLKPYRNHLRFHFLSNIDVEHFNDLLKKIHLETTLFLISSKTFRTQETLTNAYSIKKFFLKKAKNEKHMNNHFIAISMNIHEAKKFGVKSENIFKIWDWVGGRYSLWSAIGIPIVLSIGFSNFKQILAGANSMDRHFYESDFKKNIPVIMALIEIWYNNFFKFETTAVLPYNYCLRNIPNYLQQLGMESNGKNIDRNHQTISYQSNPIIWGGSGIDGQHAFYQLFHQGTKIIPCDFIGSVCVHDSDNEKSFTRDHHNRLMSNFFAQSEILAFGNIKKEQNICKKSNDILYIHKFLFGNKPSNSILIRKITPYVMGSLIAMYEHKTFSQGVILNIFSFDQWGVEFGKKSANYIFSEINDPLKKKVQYHDSSTNGLINLYKKWKIRY